MQFSLEITIKNVQEMMQFSLEITIFNG